MDATGDPAVPAQCPSCGRFLKADLVGALAVEDAPCPRCGEVLTRAMFAADEALTSAPEPLATSVRPPDLPSADAVAPDDPLAGWDSGESPWQPPPAPVDVDARAVARGAAVGALAGALLLRRHRGRGLVLGAAAGAVTVGAARRIWQLPD